METKENVDPFYIKEEFHAIRNKISEFNKKNYPGYEDVDIKLIIAKCEGIDDFDTLHAIYEKLEKQDLLNKLKMEMKKAIDFAARSDEQKVSEKENKISVIQKLEQNKKMVAKSSDYATNHIKNKDTER